jgi:hypothetical protein
MKLSFIVQGLPAATTTSAAMPVPQNIPVQVQTVTASAQDSSESVVPASPVAPSAATASTPKVPPKGGGLSLKDMLKKAEQRAQGIDVSANPSETTGERPFTMDEFMVAWKELIEGERGAGRTSLAVTLEQYAPIILEDGLTVEFYVSNDAQKGWIEEKRLLKMISWMRGKLQNKRMNLKVEVAASSDDDTSPKLYTNRDKGEFLLKEHESVRELAQKLELDIK